MTIATKIQSIPTIMRSIVMGVLTIITIYVMYQPAEVILNLFTPGTPMQIVAILAYWLIILFTTWILPWLLLFKPEVITEK